MSVCPSRIDVQRPRFGVVTCVEACLGVSHATACCRPTYNALRGWSAIAEYLVLSIVGTNLRASGSYASPVKCAVRRCYITQGLCVIKRVCYVDVLL